MAGEYFRWKYRDVKPDEASPPLKGWKKFANWFHYNKLWLLVGAVLICILGSILWSALGIGKVKPDYIFAYIGQRELPKEAAAALTERLQALGEDVNGDGKVTVELRQYATNPGGDAETALQYQYATDVTLIADIDEGDSYFFLAEDPSGVQLSYEIFANADGTPPANGDFEVADKVFSCESLPALADIPDLSSLYLGRRCFYDEEQAREHAADAALWNILTEGASQ